MARKGLVWQSRNKKEGHYTQADSYGRKNLWTCVRGPSSVWEKQEEENG